MVPARLPQSKKLVVDLRDAGRVAGAEVLASLLGQGVDHLAAVRRAPDVGSLEGSGVERPSLVPGVDAAVVVRNVCMTGLSVG